MAWLANTDFAPCTDEKSVIHYLAKYTSKEEKKSEKLIDIGKNIVERLPTSDPTTDPLLRYIPMLYNKMISERDWSAQEVCHLLLGLDLHRGSRAVSDLDVRPNSVQRRNLNLEDGVAVVADTWIEQYCRRDENMEAESLLEVMRGYNWRRKAFAPVRNQKILNVYPRPNQQKDPAKWCRVKILPHHPFRNVDESDLLAGYAGWEEAYEHRRRHHTHPSDPLGDLLNAEVPSSDESVSNDGDINEDQQDDELMALRNPHHGEGTGPIETNLGRRPENLEYDWLHRDFDINVSQTEQHMESSAHGSFNADPPPPASLNLEQRDVFDRILNHYLQGREGQLLLHADGVAGTGKSRVQGYRYHSKAPGISRLPTATA